MARKGWRRGKSNTRTKNRNPSQGRIDGDTPLIRLLCLFGGRRKRGGGLTIAFHSQPNIAGGNEVRGEVESTSIPVICHRELLGKQWEARQATKKEETAGHSSEFQLTSTHKGQGQSGGHDDVRFWPRLVSSMLTSRHRPSTGNCHCTTRTEGSRVSCTWNSSGHN